MKSGLMISTCSQCGRPPRGGRGLKLIAAALIVACCPVAPLAGGVD